MDELRFSEDEAYRRIEAARLLNRFPVVLELIQSGQVSLSVLCALKAHVTVENHVELLEGVRNSSRRNAEEWLARRFPRPDVREVVRQLPAPRVRVSDTQGSEVAECSLGTGPAPDTMPPVVVPPDRRRASVEPLSEERFAIHLSVSREVKKQLDEARGLMRHQNATGALEPIIAAAVAALVEQLRKKKFGASERRGKGNTDTVTPKSEAEPLSHAAPMSSRAVSVRSVGGHAQRRGYIASATRRVVVARDGVGCSNVGSDGRRCGSCEFLEFDHREPTGIGGSSEAANVRLLCRAHNQAEAERVYGKAFMKAARRRGQKKRRPISAGATEGAPALPANKE